MHKIIILLLVVNFGFAQDVNSYKYALVPSKFVFQTEKGQFNLNNLTRMILESNGFESYIDDEKLPDDLVRDNCNKVFVDLDVSNTMFVTKLKIVLKDCKNNVIFSSQEGKSSEKSQALAYVQALKMASQSLKTMRHQFVATKLNSVAALPIIKVENNNKVSNLLTVQKTTTGFDLFSAETKKLILNLRSTSIKDIYIAMQQGSNCGIVFKSEGLYYFEYYTTDRKITEQVIVDLTN